MRQNSWLWLIKGNFPYTGVYFAYPAIVRAAYGKPMHVALTGFRAIV